MGAAASAVAIRQPIRRPVRKFICLVNSDVIDLYDRIPVWTKVVVRQQPTAHAVFCTAGESGQASVDSAIQHHDPIKLKFVPLDAKERR
jgi:hypothetical protein